MTVVNTLTLQFRWRTGLAVGDYVQILFKLRSTVVHIICKHPTSGSIIEAPCGWCRKILKNYKQLHAGLGIRLMHSISFENMHKRGKHIIKTMIWRLLQTNCKNGWICVACFLLPQNILAQHNLNFFVFELHQLSPEEVRSLTPVTRSLFDSDLCARHRFFFTGPSFPWK